MSTTPHTTQIILYGAHLEPLQLELHPSKSVSFGQLIFGLHKRNTSHQHHPIIQVGVAGGVYTPATLVHEAVHATTYYMKDQNWRDWAPRWDCRYRKEETTAWLTESIFFHSDRFARRVGLTPLLQPRTTNVAYKVQLREFTNGT